MRYILFKKVEVRQSNSAFMAFFSRSAAIDGEEWNEKKKYAMTFIAECETSKDVITHVQRDPNGVFLLFRGDVEEMKCAIPVVVGGKNFNTMCEHGSTDLVTPQEILLAQQMLPMEFAKEPERCDECGHYNCICVDFRPFDFPKY